MTIAGRILPDLRAEAQLRTYSPKGSVTVEAVRACRDEGLSKDATAERLGCSLATVTNRSQEGDITWRRGPKARRGSNLSRFASRNADQHASRAMPAVNNPAFTEARTLYPSTRTPAAEAPRILVSGFNSWKIGAEVTKGPWRGFPIYTLTLEERATCPTACHHWRSCFGNNMRFARRLVHGADFEARLTEELVELQATHPRGFAVRLHVLGDFYSVAYVRLWRFLIGRLPALHAFGFTARWEVTDPIARELIELVLERWDRFAVRFSNAPVDECSTVSIEHPIQKPDDAIVCPQQVGKTSSCGTCGLCWHSRRRIAFLRH